MEDEYYPLISATQKFPVGKVVATATFVDRLNNMGVEPSIIVMENLRRHQQGDWGDCGKEDADTNDRALNTDGRLMSVYHVKGADGEQTEKIWVITEWDRSVTTFLLPEDY